MRQRTQAARRCPFLVEWLEPRLALTGGPTTVALDPNFDQFGDQVVTVMSYASSAPSPGDPGLVASFGIFDTGASAVTFSPDDAALFDFFNAPIPIKVPDGALAGGIGGEIVGDVSEPGYILADGIHASTLTFDDQGFPEFGFDFTGGAYLSGIQAFVGTDAGSPDLPTITGIPFLHPSPENPDGLAARIDLQGQVLDFSDIIPGLVLPYPDIHFVSPSTAPSKTDTSTDPVTVNFRFYGGDNYDAPGDLITDTNLLTQPDVGGATVGGTAFEHKNFLFDTGAQLSVISTSMAQSLGLDLANPETTIDVQGVGGTETVPGYTLASLTVPTADGSTLTWTDVPVYVLDVADDIDGILGMNLFNTAETFLVNPWDPAGTPTVTTTFQLNPDRTTLDFGGDDGLNLLRSLGGGLAGALIGHALPGFQPLGMAPTAPSAPALQAASDTGQSPSDRITAATSPTFDVANVAGGAVVQLYRDGNLVATAVAPTVGGTVSLQDPGGLVDGTYSYTAAQVDAANQSSPTSPATSITVDTVAPAAPALAVLPADDSGLKGDRRTSVRRPRLTGTTEPYAAVELRDAADNVLATATAAADGSFTLSTTADLPLGVVALRTRATDVAGNVGSDGAGATLTIARPTLGAADFDGDGKTDLAVFRRTDARWLVLQSGGGSQVIQFGQGNIDQPIQGDFDGDGKQDLAVFRPTDAKWLILYSGGGSKAFQFGQGSVDRAVPADYDGDGKTDLAVFRTTTAQYLILYSGGGSRVQQFGQAGVDRAIPADFDGDGKADLAVFRPTTATYLVLYSGGGSRVQQFAQPGVDEPIPADFDGDGKVDLAVFRPTESKWLVLYSGGGSRVIQFGQPLTDVPIPLPLSYTTYGDIHILSLTGGNTAPPPGAFAPPSDLLPPPNLARRARATAVDQALATLYGQG